MNYYTYIYLDPTKPGSYQYGDYTFEYEPFYVGKGSNNQLYSHLNFATGCSTNAPINKHKHYKIKNILQENLKPIIFKVRENLFEQEAFELEIWLIWAIGRRDLGLGVLTNLTHGGEGLSGKIYTKNQKYNFSKLNSGKNNPMYGKHPTLETRQKMSKWQQFGKNPMKGKFHSEKAREKMSITKKGKPSGMLGKKHSDEVREKMSSSAKGKLKSNEHKHKISDSLKGKARSEQHNKNLSISHKGIPSPMKGKKHSDETKQKIKDS